MTKTIVTLIVILMSLTAVTACAQTPVASQPPENTTGSVVTSTPSAVKESSRPSPEPLTTTPETVVFPKIPTTEDVGAQDLIALLGEPDKLIENIEGESQYLFFSKYNRVFGVGEGYLWDMTHYYESYGGISGGMSQKQVIEVLGEPNTKGNPEYEGDATGVWCQVWTYDSGMSVTFRSADESISEAWVGDIGIDKNSELKLGSGIGIGTSKEDVIGTYCIGIYPDDQIEDTFVRVGDTYGFIFFNLYNGKVIGIWKGSHNN